MSCELHKLAPANTAETAWPTARKSGLFFGNFGRFLQARRTTPIAKLAPPRQVPAAAPIAQPARPRSTAGAAPSPRCRRLPTFFAATISLVLTAATAAAVDLPGDDAMLSLHLSAFDAAITAPAARGRLARAPVNIDKSFSGSPDAETARRFARISATLVRWHGFQCDTVRSVDFAENFNALSLVCDGGDRSYRLTSTAAGWDVAAR
jgi:hypothetical protein